MALGKKTFLYLSKQRALKWTSFWIIVPVGWQGTSGQLQSVPSHGGFSASARGFPNR